MAAAKASQPRNQGKPRAKWVSQQEIAGRREANQCLRCGSNKHYIRQYYLALARRPNTTLAPKKKQKVYTTATKTKKKGTSTPITIKEVESKEDSDLVYRPEND